MLESLGRKAKTFSYKIPFRDGIFLSQYENAFTDIFPLFIVACLDRTAGILVDPILGEQPALVSQFSYDLDALKKDGVDVDVEFIHAPVDYFKGDDRPTVQALSTQAADMDNRAATVNWGAQTPPTSFKDPITAITSLSDQITGNVDRMAATLDSVSFKLQKMNQSLQKLGNVKNWSVIRATKNLQATLLDTKQTLGGGPSGKQLHTFITTVPIGVTVLANQLGVSSANLISMNPTLAQSPKVPAGVSVRYFTGN